MKPPVYVDDPEQVTTTMNSIKIAEGLTGGVMPDPSMAKEKAKIAPTPNYHLADSDDEEDDTGDSTIETRKSVNTVENMLKRRWFINAREEKDFNKMKASGDIRQEVLDFSNKDIEGITTTDAEIATKGAKKKKAAVEAADKAEAEKGKSEKEKKDEAEAKDVDDGEKAAQEKAAEDGKKEGEEKKAAADKAAKGGDAAAKGDDAAGGEKKDDAAADEDWVPPELRGALEGM